MGTGGISHWPATPDSGKINEQWDRDFLKNGKIIMLRLSSHIKMKMSTKMGVKGDLKLGRLSRSPVRVKVIPEKYGFMLQYQFMQ